MNLDRFYLDALIANIWMSGGGGGQFPQFTEP